MSGLRAHASVISRLRLRAIRASGLAVLLAGAVLAAVLAGPEPSSGEPLDPRSSAPLGTKALVDVLRGLDVDVAVSRDVPTRSALRALLLSDLLDEPERAALRDWVSGGGRLVLTDTNSPLAPDVTDAVEVGILSTPIAKGCDLPALRDVERISAPGGDVFVPPGGRGSERGEGAAAAVHCFPRNGGAWLVAQPLGKGVIVALGGPSVFVNERLREADNGLLAVALLGGDGRVAVLDPGGPGYGRSGLLELLDPRVIVACAQLALAFAVVVAWRARRLGRPIVEPALVRIPGSELVLAVGDLLQHASARRRAAEVLRAQARRRLSHRLGLPATAAPDEIVAAAAGHLEPLSEREVRSVLDGPAPPDEEALVQLAGELERVGRALG